MIQNKENLTHENFTPTRPLDLEQNIKLPGIWISPTHPLKEGSIALSAAASKQLTFVSKKLKISKDQMKLHQKMEVAYLVICTVSHTSEDAFPNTFVSSQTFLHIPTNFCMTKDSLGNVWQAHANARKIMPSMQYRTCHIWEKVLIIILHLSKETVRHWMRVLPHTFSSIPRAMIVKVKISLSPQRPVRIIR